MLPILTLQNLMTYNDTLFDNIVLPEGADRDTLVSTIIMQYGDMQVLCPDWPVLRYYVQNWFSAHLQQLTHLWKDYVATYDPVYNKDSFIEETRTPALIHTETRSDHQEGAGSSSETGSTKNQYRGFQSSTFSDVSKEVPDTHTNSNAENATNGLTQRSETGKEDIFRHEYGNIGVQTAADVISRDLKLHTVFNWYDMTAKLWAVDNLIMVY